LELEQWATVLHMFYAQSGYQVSLVDISQTSLDKAIATIGKTLIV